MKAESHKPLTFLVVDDDIRLSLFFKETLVQGGHKVFVAVNEHGALEFLKKESVDIMLCDLILPGLDGSKIISIVKELFPRTYCVLISGHHDQIFSRSFPHTDADLVIGKPIFKDTLKNIVQHYHTKYQET